MNERTGTRNTPIIASFALILAIAALIVAVVALVAANNNTKKLEAQTKRINILKSEVQHLDRPATTGAGVGPNTGAQSVGNPLPNGSGQ